MAQERRQSVEETGDLRWQPVTDERQSLFAIRHQLSAIRPPQLPLDNRVNLQYTTVVYSEHRSTYRTGYDPWLIASPPSIARCAF